MEKGLNVFLEKEFLILYAKALPIRKVAAKATIA